MATNDQNIIVSAYQFFNARNIDAVLALMDENVHWPNGWEGGYVEGHAAVREYWTRQWKELDPRVDPVEFAEARDGRITVDVHQVAKDMQGNLVFDGMVKHVYTIKDGLIETMEIEKG
jgi:ketosteroid isomerase-like protein